MSFASKNVDGNLEKEVSGNGKNILAMVGMSKNSQLHFCSEKQIDFSKKQGLANAENKIIVKNDAEICLREKKKSCGEKSSDQEDELKDWAIQEKNSSKIGKGRNEWEEDFGHNAKELVDWNTNGENGLEIDQKAEGVMQEDSDDFQRKKFQINKGRVGKKDFIEQGGQSKKNLGNKGRQLEDRVQRKDILELEQAWEEEVKKGLNNLERNVEMQGNNENFENEDGVDCYEEGRQTKRNNNEIAKKVYLQDLNPQKICQKDFQKRGKQNRSGNAIKFEDGNVVLKKTDSDGNDLVKLTLGLHKNHNIFSKKGSKNKVSLDFQNAHLGVVKVHSTCCMKFASWLIHFLNKITCGACCKSAKKIDYYQNANLNPIERAVVNMVGDGYGLVLKIGDEYTDSWRFLGDIKQGMLHYDISVPKKEIADFLRNFVVNSGMLDYVCVPGLKIKTIGNGDQEVNYV